jgi:ABC-2 type transport system ATP-binding protein
MISDPHVLLLDEPAAGLDPAGRIQFRQLLASLRDMGKAIIVSSHILADLAEYCTHIAFMERGRMRRFGTVAHVAGALDTTRSHYHVALLQAPGDLAKRLEPLADVTVVSMNGEQLLLEYGASRAEAAELLQRLLKAGLPVAEFHTARPDLEQAYLRSGIAQVD